MVYILFKNMTRESQIILFEAWLNGKKIEASISREKWVIASDPLWQSDVYYRVREEPVTYPTVDWSQFNDNYNWIATDQDRETYVYQTEPKVNGTGYMSSAEQLAILVIGLTSFKPGTCDWKNSKSCRPGFTEK